MAPLTLTDVVERNNERIQQQLDIWELLGRPSPFEITGVDGLIQHFPAGTKREFWMPPDIFQREMHDWAQCIEAYYGSVFVYLAPSSDTLTLIS
jgi:hypothetical protein